MQQIDAVIDQVQLREVRSTLQDLGIEDFMESTIKYHQQGQEMKFRGARLMANIVEKIKLEIIAADESVDRIVEAIDAIARTEDKEACRIAVYPYQAVS